MATRSRTSRLLAGFVSLLLLAAPMAQAQYAPLPPPTTLDLADPWIYRGTDIPRDPEWKFGELANGLRYAVRSNGVPPGQASIRISIGAGILHEDDGQRGFAHLIEHLSFRESKYLGNAQAIPTWQRLGARLGDETNAQTTPTQTVYMLDLPDAGPANTEETVRLLSGMVREPALSEENIAAELPIVLSEMRDGGGAGKRVGDARLNLLYRGQRLGNQVSDGIAADLRAATSAGLKAFHRDWYRPENAVVVIVGDGPASQYAALIERYFSDWRVDGTMPPEPDFGRPQAPANSDPANPVGETAVQVEPDLPRSLTWGILRPWVQVVDNLEFNRERMVSFVAERILNQRLKDRERNGGRYIAAQAQRSDEARSANLTLVDIGPRDGDWQGALEDVRGVIADAIENPPSEEEIAREVAAIDLFLQDGLAQAVNRPSPDLADEVVQAVDIREAVASAQTFLDVFRSTRARFTPQAIQEQTRQMFAGAVSRLHYLTPVAGEAEPADLRRALLAPVKPDPAARLSAAVPDFAELPPIGTPAPAISEMPLGVNGISQVAYANGVKALLWRTGNEPGRVRVRVRFGSGLQGFAQEDAPYIRLGEAALIASGFGDVDTGQLEQLAKGRKFGFDFAVGEASFVFEAETRAEDLADQLYLFAAKLAMPRWDAQPFDRARALLKLQYQSYNTDPMGVLERDLEYILSDGDRRFATSAPDQLDSLSLEGFRRVWEPLLAQGPVEVIVFGDIDPAATMAAMSRTFGALPARQPIPEAALTRGIGFPAPQGDPRMLVHRGDPDQAAAVVAWKLGGGSAGIGEGRQIEVLAEIFSNRLVDALREQAGASYAPFVVSNWPADIDSGGRMTALAQLPPEMVPGFFAVVDRIAADLAANGPNPDEMQRVTEPNRQFLNRAQYGSLFWMNRVEGATIDPQRLFALNSIVSDYTQVPPERIQELARTWLAPDGAIRLGVIPEAPGAAAAELPEGR